MRKNNSTKTIYVLVAIILLEAILLVVSSQKKERVSPYKHKEEKVEKPRKEIIVGRIAIVLDDWGYNLNKFKLVEAIDGPLTLSILPNLPYSATIAQMAQAIGGEVILHLPLEPYHQQSYRLEQDTIMVNMSKAKVIKILEKDFDSVPGLKGVSNHMGSKATENKALMKIIFAKLKERKLYFLDSFTSKTVCKEIANSYNIPYIQRQVFLDNQSDYDYISSQIEALAKVALRRGYAIGIGHCRIKTLEVLARAIPELKKRGFKFVCVSELVK